MPWYWWLGALTLVSVVGVVKGKRTRRKVWRSIRAYARKRRNQRLKASGKARTARRQVQGQTRAQTQPRRRSPAGWQQAPLLTPKPVKRAPILRARVCDMKCRKSRKPASTCDCACGGRDHGRYVKGTAASIRATKYTPAQQRAQRHAEAGARNQRWEQRQRRLQSKGKPVTRGGKGGQST